MIHVILVVHVSTEMKPSSTVKQKEYEVCFSSRNPMKASVHNIQSWSIICVVEFVNHSFLIWMHMQQFCQILCHIVDMPSCCTCWVTIFLEISPFQHHFRIIFPHLVCVFCIVSYCLAWKLLLKYFHIFGNVCNV